MSSRATARVAPTIPMIVGATLAVALAFTPDSQPIVGTTLLLDRRTLLLRWGFHHIWWLAVNGWRRRSLIERLTVTRLRWRSLEVGFLIFRRCELRPASPAVATNCATSETKQGGQYNTDNQSKHEAEKNDLVRVLEMQALLICCVLSLLANGVKIGEIKNERKQRLNEPISPVRNPARTPVPTFPVTTEERCPAISPKMR